MTKRRSQGPNVYVELDCVKDCSGACCRLGTGIFMNRAEAGSNLLKIRTKTLAEPRDEDSEPIRLTEKDQAFQIPAGYGYYKFVADCGHLTLENTCNVYDSPSPTRPDACKGLVAGTLPCLVIRAMAGFDDELQGDTARIVAETIVD